MQKDTTNDEVKTKIHIYSALIAYVIFLDGLAIILFSLHSLLF